MDAFNYVKDIPILEPTGKVAGLSQLNSVQTLQVGTGAQAFHTDQQGQWQGATKFADAPFSVDMDGNMIASSLTATGYIAVGGAAGDVNSGATTISGGKITTNSIAADRIVTGDLVVGTNVGLGTAQTSGQVTTIVGNTVTTGFVNALNVTANSVAAENITGTYITGKVVRTAASGARVELNGSDNRLSIYSSGALAGYIQQYSGHLGVIGSAGQVVLSGLNYVEIFDSYLKLDSEIRSAGQNSYWKDNNGDTICWFDGSDNSATFTKLFVGATEITKNAIVPTSQGYNALYCMESPEVWFMDFCESKDSIDPMFLEVTEGDMKFIKLDGEGYQVWRRRKGFVNTRFEKKTEKEYIKNNKFWATPLTT